MEHPAEDSAEESAAEEEAAAEGEAAAAAAAATTPRIIKHAGFLKTGKRTSSTASTDPRSSISSADGGASEAEVTPPPGISQRVLRDSTRFLKIAVADWANRWVL